MMNVMKINRLRKVYCLHFFIFIPKMTELWGVK